MRGFLYRNWETAFSNCVRKDWPGLRAGGLSPIQSPNPTMQHITQQRPAGATFGPFEYVTKGPAIIGASRLVSLPYLNGAQIRAYRDLNGIAWFILVDVYRAISAKNPGNMRKRVKTTEDVTEVKAWVANSVYPEASGFRFIAAMSEGGMDVMLGISKQEPSIALRKWMIEVAAPILRIV